MKAPANRARVSFWMILLLSILSIVYLRTLLTTVGYTGDTAKFQFIGYVLGTPHAPGYPTYLMLNHVFTKFIPVGTLAYKANLLSAIFSVLAALFLFRTLLLLEVKSYIAFLTSLTFGFTRTLWSQSLVAEVYTLNILFISIVVYFLLKWTFSRKNFDLLVACAAYALSFGNHLTMITFLPAIFYLVWVTDHSVFTKPRLVFPILMFIVLGAAQYAYLLWRYYDPTVQYVEMETPNLKELLLRVSGGQFKSRMFQFSIVEAFTLRIPLFLKFVILEYLFLIPVAFLGFLQLKQNRTVNTFLLLGIAGNMFWIINYEIPDIFVYMIPSYFLMAIYIGVGLQKIETFLSAKHQSLNWSRGLCSGSPPLEKGGVRGWWKRLPTNELFNPLLASPSSEGEERSIKFNMALVSGIIMILVPLFFLVPNYRHVDQSDKTQEAKRIEEALEIVNSNAIIIPQGYREREYLLYYVIGEGLKKDNLFVVGQFSFDEIDAYLRCNKPFYIRQIRTSVPMGLRVYCLGPRHRELFAKKGLLMLRTGKSLFEIGVDPKAESKKSCL